METKENKTVDEKVTKERDILEAEKMRVQAKKQEREHTHKVNKLWMWLGVLLLIFILLWWLWTIGTFEDLFGVTNG